MGSWEINFMSPTVLARPRRAALRISAVLGDYTNVPFTLATSTPAAGEAP